jgi:hypothetical protein
MLEPTIFDELTNLLAALARPPAEDEKLVSNRFSRSMPLWLTAHRFVKIREGFVLNEKK